MNVFIFNQRWRVGQILSFITFLLCLALKTVFFRYVRCTFRVKSSSPFWIKHQKHLQIPNSFKNFSGSLQVRLVRLLIEVMKESIITSIYFSLFLLTLFCVCSKIYVIFSSEGHFQLVSKYEYIFEWAQIFILYLGRHFFFLDGVSLCHPG